MTSAGEVGRPEPGAKGPLTDAATYAIAAAVPRTLTFLMLPIYTAVMTPDQYGSLAVMLAIYSAAAIVWTFGLDSAVFRMNFELSEDPVLQREFVAAIWSISLIVPVAMAAVIGGVVFLLVDNVATANGSDVVIALVGAAVYAGATTVPLAVLRANRRLKAYVLLTVGTGVVTAALTVIAVVAFDGGTTGWLLAVLLGNAAMLVAAGILVPWRLPYRFPRDRVRAALGFGLPLVPHFLSHWALQLADRTVMAGLVGAGALGVYSLGATLALPVMVLVQSLNLGFMPDYARAGTARTDVERFRRILSDRVVLQVAIVAAITVVGALLLPPLADHVAPQTYQGADEVVGWIVLGFGFLGLYYIPMNGVSLGAGTTRNLWVATAGSAALNLGLVVWLVPDHGIAAAGQAAAAGYAALLVWIFVLSRRRGSPVDYPWSRIAAVIVTAIAVYWAVGLVVPADTPVEIALRAGSLMVAALVLYVFRRRVTHVRYS